MTSIDILQIGLGPLGRKMIIFMAERPAFRLVSAVDNDAALVGKDAGELCGLPRTGITVTPNLRKAAADSKPHIAVVTTVSGIKRITPLILEILGLGIPVVTSCEELSYPWITAPEEAAALHACAAANNVAVLATGVNPGFLMDLLPVTLTAVCKNVDKVVVRRFQNAEFRRVPFQKKIGAGLSLEEFEKKRKEGTLRHVGLTESIHMIAARFGWTLEKTTEELSPVTAAARIETKDLVIEPGSAAGVRQVGRGFVNGREKIVLEFQAAVGEKKPVDSVEIQGEPSFVSSVPGGINGDIATCALTLNAVPRVLEAIPGLHTMTDISPVSFFETVKR
ncbi:MAG: dihydrodipicolinate reductase [Spirochaetales bacterium]|nr:MAG: dihydrodipicolinate reductase [Spirochaetales bacterium]